MFLSWLGGSFFHPKTLPLQGALIPGIPYARVRQVTCNQVSSHNDTDVLLVYRLKGMLLFSDRTQRAFLYFLCRRSSSLLHVVRIDPTLFIFAPRSRQPWVRKYHAQLVYVVAYSHSRYFLEKDESASTSSLRFVPRKQLERK